MDPAQHKASTRAAYERLAEVWDDTDDNLWNEALERTTVRLMLPQPLAGQRVLDAGCASGAHAAWFAERGCRVTGFDVSPSMVREASRRLAGRAQLVVADLADPPFLDGTFDGILCSLALHYVGEPAGTLRHFARILQPGGWLLVSLDHPFGQMPGEESPDYFTTRMVTDSWSKKGGEGTQSFWRRPLGSVVDDFADAGFVIERIGEPKLDDDLRRRFPADAAKIEGRPSFIAYLARLRQT